MEENRELSANDEELEEEVFRKRKVELTTAVTGAPKTSFTVCKLEKSNFRNFFAPLNANRLYLLDKLNFTVIKQFVLHIASNIEKLEGELLALGDRGSSHLLTL